MQLVWLLRLWEEPLDLASHSECSRDSQPNPSEAGDIAGEMVVASHTEKGQEADFCPGVHAGQILSHFVSIAVIKTMAKTIRGRKAFIWLTHPSLQ